MKKLMMIAVLCLLAGAFLSAQNQPAGVPGNETSPAVKNAENTPPPPQQGFRGPQMRFGQGMPGGEMKEACQNCTMQMNKPGQDREGMEGRGRQMPQNMRGQQERQEQEMMENRLREIDPKKFEEISKLKDQVREMTQQLMEKARKDEEDFRKLVEKYRETKADTDKAALRAKIEERMKNNLESQKQRISEEEKNIQSKVDRILNEITSEKGPAKEKKNETIERK
ncbi:MAG TPA: hypothetical protein DCZ94_09835 [Lentisphaeria bacterium]|nr:MAG: hypothetical protein A2X48_19075 [Lentisphaerae bacterium GWF2_49_21]HBC87243.1 hypothetical protein [Lentisphaeria bacterium]